LPKHVLISHAHKCFSAAGEVVDPAVSERLEDFGASLVERVAQD
jgi:hypothetical protein